MRPSHPFDLRRRSSPYECEPAATIYCDFVASAMPNRVVSGKFRSFPFKSQRAASTAEMAMEEIPGRPRLRMDRTIASQAAGIARASCPVMTPARRSRMSAAVEESA